MYKNRLLKKALTLLLCLLTLFHNATVIKAEEFNNVEAIIDTTNADNLTEEFYNASEDTIVCYMDGVAICKEDVDENGMIKQEVMDVINIRNGLSISTFSTSTPVKNYKSIPSKYNNAIVSTTITAPRYEQKNTIYYLTAQKGAVFASNLEVGAAASLIAMAAGFIPYVGPVITITFTFSSLYTSSVASQVRSLTNYTKKVRINQASSGYGTFYGVSEWTGLSIETHTTYPSGSLTTETLNNVQYSK